MILKIIKNTNEEKFILIKEAVKQNDGYCPCVIEKTDDFKCMCKPFRDKTDTGLCHCELYEKVVRD